MQVKAYICPQCGAALNVYDGTEITQCPSCKASIHISYQGERVTNRREFKAPDGTVLANAVIPADYELSGTISRQWQSEMVPFTTYVKATSPDHAIYMSSGSREIYHDLRNMMLITAKSLLRNHTENGYQKFVEEEQYIDEFASRHAGIPLTPVGKTRLPSMLANNPEAAKALLENNMYNYGVFMEAQPKAVNSLIDPVLYRYAGALNGSAVVVLAGADYEGAELIYNLGSEMLEGLSDAAEKAMNSVRNAFTRSTGKELPSGSEFRETAKNVLSGKEKMTASDWMKGGLIGKMMRDKKNAAMKAPEPVRTEETKKPEGPAPFGHSKEYGKHVDHILYGAERTYFCMFRAEREEEATAIFRKFVSTLMPDSGLSGQEMTMLNNKLELIRQEAAGNQARARAEQARLRSMQIETSRMIARNSAEASAGLMDSWQKKMDSDSRISRSYSEAVRGVDTYQKTDGSYAEVSTAADHVYQNAYGEVYGVSGNAPDAEVLNSLEWTEIHRK